MEAIYTKTFKAWLNEPSEIQGQMDNRERLSVALNNAITQTYVPDIISELEALYWNLEIVYSDNLDFIDALVFKLKSFNKYYTELLSAYQTSINMLDGRKTVTTREGENTATGSSNISKDNTNKNYNLPNKAINEGKGNLSQQSELNESEGRETEGSNEYNETITTTGGENVIELKKQYLALIRDYIREWCMKCEDCFLQIYS